MKCDRFRRVKFFKDEFLKPLGLPANAAQLSKRGTLLVVRAPLNDFNGPRTRSGGLNGLNILNDLFLFTVIAIRPEDESSLPPAW
jgi:hypothetical protein